MTVALFFSIVWFLAFGGFEVVGCVVMVNCFFITPTHPHTNTHPHHTQHIHTHLELAPQDAALALEAQRRLAARGGDDGGRQGGWGSGRGACHQIRMRKSTWRPAPPKRGAASGKPSNPKQPPSNDSSLDCQTAGLLECFPLSPPSPLAAELCLVARLELLDLAVGVVLDLAAHLCVCVPLID